ncbi:MAG: ester cyclase [Acidimicrobiales bacterium]
MSDNSVSGDMVGDSKAVALRAMESLDRRDMDGVLAETTPDCTWLGFGPEPLDRAGYIEAIGRFLDAFGDSRFPIDAVVAEADVVAVQHRLVGTHTGEFRGVAPSGQPVSVPAIAVFRVTDGQVTQVSLHADLLGLLMQIGAIPAPSPN